MPDDPPPPPPPPPGDNPPPPPPGGDKSGIGEPWAKSWIKPDFSLDHAALERLPEHLKGLRPTLERQKNFEDVLTVMQNQQVLTGKKALAPLPPGSTPEVIAERKALLDSINGVPADFKQYGVARPPELPENQWNQPLADAFAQWAHKNSVPPSAVKELFGVQLGFIRQQLDAQRQYEATYWGKEDKAFEAAIRSDNIPAERVPTLIEKGLIALGIDPNNEQVKLIMRGNVARQMALRHALSTAEDTFVQGESKPGTGDPKQAALDIAHNPANPLYPAFWNKDGKYPREAHEQARAKYEELMRLAVSRMPPSAGRGRR
ncbi:MAG: hypothetical protein ABSH26_18045 [Opitutaceae bacterium]|jgi:hypothetical protein